MGRGYLVVEGQGDVKAAPNLISRLWMDLELRPLHWAEPIRGKRLHARPGISQVCGLVRGRDAEALLILRDEDDACPKEEGPQSAAWLREQALEFPAAIVLAHREYETWFLPCVDKMAGSPLRDDRGVEREGLLPGTSFQGTDYEAVRGVKEWLSEHLPPGRSYKSTLDQLPMTRMMDFDTIRQAGIPSFETLERALRFLATTRQPGAVYPSAR